jgi:hypothetical protein
MNITGRMRNGPTNHINVLNTIWFKRFFSFKANTKDIVKHRMATIILLFVVKFIGVNVAIGFNKRAYLIAQ